MHMRTTQHHCQRGSAALCGAALQAAPAAVQPPARAAWSAPPAAASRGVPGAVNQAAKAGCKVTADHSKGLNVGHKQRLAAGLGYGQVHPVFLALQGEWWQAGLEARMRQSITSCQATA